MALKVTAQGFKDPDLVNIPGGTAPYPGVLVPNISKFYPILGVEQAGLVGTPDHQIFTLYTELCKKRIEVKNKNEHVYECGTNEH